MTECEVIKKIVASFEILLVFYKLLNREVCILGILKKTCVFSGKKMTSMLFLVSTDSTRILTLLL